MDHGLCVASTVENILIIGVASAQTRKCAGIVETQAILQCNVWRPRQQRTCEEKRRDCLHLINTMVMVHVDINDFHHNNWDLLYYGYLHTYLFVCMCLLYKINYFEKLVKCCCRWRYKKLQFCSTILILLHMMHTEPQRNQYCIFSSG